MSWKQLWPVRTAAAAASWLAAIGTGARVSAPITGTPDKPAIRHGLTASAAGIKAMVPAAVALKALDLIAGSPMTARAASGTSAATVLQSILASPIGGAELVHTRFDLTGTYGANASTVSGTKPWTSPANAHGTNNGIVASISGDITTATDAILDLTYPDSFNKTALTITAARVDVHYSFAGAPTGEQSVTFTYSVDGSTPSVVLTGESWAASRPLSMTSVDLSSVIDTWAKVDAFKARARFIAPIAGTLITASVDAVELVITATRTDLN